MTSYSQNLLLAEPTPLDPVVSNAWAAIVNTNMSLLDSAVSGLTSIALPAQSGYPTVALTSTSGAGDQARNQHFTFTGVLTANTLVLWPASLDRFFSVTNACTGAFTLTLGTNNGSGAAAGTTYAISQGVRALLFSDGTNLALRTTLGGGDTSGPSSSVSGNLASFNGTGGKTLQDSGVASSAVALLNAADQTLSGGANVTSYNLGTIASGTLTIDCGKCPLQRYVNNGAHSIAAPASDGSALILMTNAAAAGAVSFTGFNVGSFTGAALTTTNGSSFTIQVWRNNGIAGYTIFAHQ